MLQAHKKAKLDNTAADRFLKLPLQLTLRQTDCLGNFRHSNWLANFAFYLLDCRLNIRRQLERQCNKSIGCSVVQFALLARLQHARVLLIATKLSVREIATASGFNTLSHFAYAFKKCFGRRPSDYRQAWPENDTAPHWPGTLGRFLDTLQPQRRDCLPR